MRTKWPQAVLGLISSNFIDVDHLLADPVYVPDRCSVTTHPLHRWFAVPFYLLMFLFKNVFVRFFAAERYCIWRPTRSIVYSTAG